LLDFVSAWYLRAAEYIQARHSRESGDPAALATEGLDSRFRGNDGIRCAFVSTNSITQGEQVGVLWSRTAAARRLHLQFAHRTFSSGATRRAAWRRCIA
jgi:hypothetical protein